MTDSEAETLPAEPSEIHESLRRMKEQEEYDNEKEKKKRRMITRIMICWRIVIRSGESMSMMNL
jgi:hypothetical protein